MDKELLKTIIEKYKEAENQVMRLDKEFGIRLWDARENNFYNTYNYIIFKLLESIYGTEKEQLLEEYIFEQIDNLTFDELFEYLSKE